MKISVLTIFPEMFRGFEEEPVIRRAIQKGAAQIEYIDVRPFAGGSFRHIDDSTFGGGAGMVLRCPPVLKALDTVRGSGSFVAALTPAGEKYDQKMAHELAGKEHLILLCGHYEGFDQRILSRADREISIGDYILTGGELAARVVMDSVIRLLEGSLRAESTAEESFENGLLEYPQYTRPADYNGEKVPVVLLSGDHGKVRRWRLKESLALTLRRRPDLLEKRILTEEERQLLAEILQEDRIQSEEGQENQACPGTGQEDRVRSGEGQENQACHGTWQEDRVRSGRKLEKTDEKRL